MRVTSDVCGSAMCSEAWATGASKCDESTGAARSRQKRAEALIAELNAK